MMANNDINSVIKGSMATFFVQTIPAQNTSYSNLKVGGKLWY